MMPYTHRNQLLDEVLPHGAVCCEVGVLTGGFAQEILARTHPKRLHLVDLWLHYPEVVEYRGVSDAAHLAHLRTVQTALADEIRRGVVSLHQGLSGTVLSSLADGLFDWIYLDSDHRYENILEELRICSRKVKPEGLIAGHDYLTGQESEIARGARYGVVEAVRDFCRESEWQIAHVTERQPSGDEGATSPSFVLARGVL